MSCNPDGNELDMTQLVTPYGTLTQHLGYTKLTSLDRIGRGRAWLWPHFFLPVTCKTLYT
jgi:hypothetical protein